MCYINFAHAYVYKEYAAYGLYLDLGGSGRYILGMIVCLSAFDLKNGGLGNFFILSKIMDIG